METFLRVTALCLTVCVLAQLLKKDVPALQLLLVLAVAAVLLVPAARAAEELFSLLNELIERSEIEPAYLAVVGKCALIAAVVRVGGDLCRDAGQSALASLIEIAGALCAAALAVPLLGAILTMILETL
ncbi:MAG: SpoIIIAC/SpoIIIAD family protein [Oscillospiraceae bacterium]